MDEQHVAEGLEAYEAPALEELGPVEELTLGGTVV
ncbi:MAG: lasso RiPP family leader peptide-containing protein [Thermoleophilia bacterium]